MVNMNMMGQMPGVQDTSEMAMAGYGCTAASTTTS